MPAQPAYITRNRHGTFYFRIVVPSPLRSALGFQREIRRSLKTDSQRLALRRARQFTARYEAVFDKVLSVIDRDDYQPTAEDLELFEAEIERAGEPGAWGAWASEPTEPTQSSESVLSDADWQEIDVQQRRSAIAKALTGSSVREIPESQRALADQLYERGISLPATRFRLLLPKLIDELALQHFHAPECAKKPPVPVHQPEPRSDAPTLYQLWEQHWRTQARLTKGKKVERTKDDEQGHACRLNILSGNKPINQLTLDDFNRIYLQILDIRASPGRKLPPPDSPAEMILANEGERRVKPATMDKLITRLSVLHSFAHSRGMTAVNPASVDKPVVDHSPAGTTPVEKAFSRSDLEAIFSGYLYTGLNIGSSKGVFPYQFWLPLLGLFTGGRLNELCQLDTEDVEQHTETGIWTITVIDDPKDRPVRKSLKNKSSRRILPIHSELIRMGFIEFVEQAQKEGREKLFSDGLSYDAKKGWGGRATHFFCRFPSASTKAEGYFHSLGIRKRDEDGRTDGKNFHSFRHTFTDLTREQGAEAYLVLPDLTGHSRAGEGMHARYGNGFSLERKQAVLENLPIPVDLSAISYADFEARLGEALKRSIDMHRAKFGLNQSELSA